MRRLRSISFQSASGRLDYAFNNAGIGVATALTDVPEDDWNRTIDVNLKGTWLCMKDGASFITGHNLVIDGGFTVQ
jgi:NAD(P)-dependent dehydrogenase (short-subunit alcohol dehydrogenase family)